MIRRAPSRFCTLIFLQLAFAGSASARELVESWHFSTKARFEAAIGTHRPVGQKLEMLVEPTLEATLAGSFHVVAIGRLLADPADKLRPGDPEQTQVWEPSRSLQIGSTTELSLRELYVERRFGAGHLTIGKQQVVWGTSDGIKVLDLVNPQDLREFILDDFVDSRLPTWMLNAGYSWRNVQAQLLWIPDRSYAELPLPGSVYEFRSPQLVAPTPTGVPVVVEDPDRPSRFFEDSEVGARLSTSIGKWDLSLNWLRAYDDLPAARLDVTSEESGPVLHATPQYRRTNYVGGTVNRTIGDLVIRSEIAYSTDRQVYTLDPTDADGIAVGSEINTVAGLDWFGFENTLASVQVFNRHTEVDAASFSPQAGWTTLPTVLLRRTFAGERAVAQFFWLIDAGRGDGMARLSLRWEWRDDLALLLGADWFYGSARGVFGEFDDADRFIVGIESTL